MCEQQFDWVPAQGGEIPPHAVVGGKTSDGEDLYIGRAYHEGSQTVGKVTDHILKFFFWCSIHDKIKRFVVLFGLNSH